MLKYKNYVILFPNGKKYIGYTSTSIAERFKAHKRQSMSRQNPLYNAIRRYGWDNIQIDVVASFSDKQAALDNEKKLIIEQKSHINENGYNVTHGGECGNVEYCGAYWMIGKTEEELKEINKKKSRPGKSNPFYGKKHSQESIDKMVSSRMRKGNYWTGSSNPAAIQIQYNGITYSTKQNMRKALHMTRTKQEKLIIEQKAILSRAQINSKEVI